MLYDFEEFKKNPSIHFEYKYFVDDSPTRYMDTISKVRGTDFEKSEAEIAEEETENSVHSILISVMAAMWEKGLEIRSFTE